MKTTHYFDTAHSGNYHIAKAAAEKAKMEFNADYRANCFKCYHFEITATTPEQVNVLDKIILATFAAPGQDEHRRNLSEWIANH